MPLLQNSLSDYFKSLKGSHITRECRDSVVKNKSLTKQASLNHPMLLQDSLQWRMVCSSPIWRSKPNIEKNISSAEWLPSAASDISFVETEGFDGIGS